MGNQTKILAENAEHGCGLRSPDPGVTATRPIDLVTIHTTYPIHVLCLAQLWNPPKKV